jgi:hypothetical protein
VRDVRAGDTAGVERPHGQLVPGSPIDCGGDDPTASPIWATLPVAIERP